jgi:hypothetical protein
VRANERVLEILRVTRLDTFLVETPPGWMLEPSAVIA